MKKYRKGGVFYEGRSCKSDNSATGAPLLGRDPDQQSRYRQARGRAIPDLIYHIAKGEM